MFFFARYPELRWPSSRCTSPDIRFLQQEQHGAARQVVLLCNFRRASQPLLSYSYTICIYPPNDGRKRPRVCSGLQGDYRTPCRVSIVGVLSMWNISVEMSPQRARAFITYSGTTRCSI
ncbi:hypothetical protein CEXT_472701 [Caerostris extrusa]|uniref:Uncharacterized protein n=1 Tax=Caerostris extrusa TaxID=172846 RepID=A0AAV4X9N7_CAEEX|nr:hypothetical protein CEXT_472701 [Caerostris extrusa]